MRGKDLLVTANSHMASLIEVPLAVRSPRLTCNEERLLIRNFTIFLSIVCSTTTVGKIYNNWWILDTVRLRWWFNDLLLPDPVRKATSSRSSFRYMASPPPFISFIGPLGWLQGNERLENFFSHFINWQACQELISLNIVLSTSHF